MNFTREPIVETVITPREGCQLLLRNSKGNGPEEFFVDAVEVVSFGHSLFFRSLERPRSFLVPMSDYEVLEQKETRMALKNPGSERSIKIGGGRDMPIRSQPAREPSEEVAAPRSEAPGESFPQQAQQQQPGDRFDKKRDRRRSRRRRGGGSFESRPQEGGAPSEGQPETFQNAPTQNGGERDVEGQAPSFISKLFPPPPTLIKETLSRYKTTEEGVVIEEKPSFSEDAFEKSPEESKDQSSDDDTKFED